jgi:uncharacterized glyoxalase superfamily protein PhnB
MAVKAVPDGFNTVSAYLVVPNAVKALEFYNKAFWAETIARMAGPDGKSTLHAEMKIGNSMIMLSEENPQWDTKSPKTLGGTPVSLHIYCEDVDALFNRAVAAGCTVTFPVMDAFWGDRYGKLTDPFGHIWGIATHKEDLSEEEISRRAAAWYASAGAQKPSDK